MTIDEAIKHCEEVAEKNDKYAEIHDSLARNHKSTYEKLTAAKFYTDFAERAADHRQFAEWLRELKDLKAFITGIYQILGEHFEYPCSNEVAAELMKERSTCFDCGGEINNEECWRRFFTTMIGEKCNDN